jgi:hypothetical protein
VEGPWCRTAPGPRRNLLHHRPALILCQPSVSAYPAELMPGARGSRLLDRRPPRYRCPAVPGLRTSARAILTVSGSSVLPSEISHLPSGTAYDRAACGSAALRQPAPSPVLRWLWPRTSLPNFPGRASAADAFTGVLLTDFAAARQFIPARPTVSLGYVRNYTHATPQCLIQPPQISRRSGQR